MIAQVFTLWNKGDTKEMFEVAKEQGLFYKYADDEGNCLYLDADQCYRLNKIMHEKKGN
jgi:hypothetical protein